MREGWRGADTRGHELRFEVSVWINEKVKEMEEEEKVGEMAQWVKLLPIMRT